MSYLQEFAPGGDPSKWPTEFGAVGLDYVPDPMVLRAAELFISGRQKCYEYLQLDGEQIWPVIERNIDGILAFFHVLMTRERVPLIDYESTFPSYSIANLIGEIALSVHPDRGVYEEFRDYGLKQLASFDPSKLPHGLAEDLGQELFSIGYDWTLDVSGLGLEKKADRDAASFILGGLIFGAYADASGTDHLLQNKRARMFAALAGADSTSARGVVRERRLFSALNRITNQDERFKLEQEDAPPTVLHHLLAQGIGNTQLLLEEALKIRSSSAGRSYRKWHGELRKAWRDGRKDAKAEAELDAVTKELKQRLSGKPLVLTKLTMTGAAHLTAHAPTNFIDANVKFAAHAKPLKVDVAIPNGLRNWFVDHVSFSRRQRLLLEMSLDRRSFDDLAHGLRNLWNRS